MIYQYVKIKYVMHYNQIVKEFVIKVQVINKVNLIN